MRVLPETRLLDGKSFFGNRIRQKKQLPYVRICRKEKSETGFAASEGGKNVTETIYEGAEKQGRTNLVAQLPKNRKQVGQPGEAESAVFMEDYAWIFGKGLAERDYSGCAVGVLLGEVIAAPEGKRIMVRGLMEATGAYRNDQVEFTEEVWSGIYRMAGSYFPNQEIVGWYLGGPGFLLAAEEKLKRVHVDNFGGGEKILLKMDSIEKEYGFYCYRDGLLCELPGYYIYYEKNAEMQLYMIQAGKVPLAEEADLPEPVMKKAYQDRKEPGRTRSRSGGGQKENGSLYRLVYASGGMVLCLAVLLIFGLAMQLKERNELRELLNDRTVQTSGGVSEVTRLPQPSEAPRLTLTPQPTLPQEPAPTQEPVLTQEPTPTQELRRESESTPLTPAPTEEVHVMTPTREYVIQRGDTLASICMKFYGSTEILEEILRINGLSDRNTIYAGQVLQLP